MLEIIAGIVLFVTVAIAITVFLSGLYVFLGTISGIDHEAFHDDEEQ
jgi:hypothetical protein